MTKHDTIQTVDVVSQIMAERRAQRGAIRRHLLKAVEIAEAMPDGQQIIGEALCGALETVGAGAPEYHAFGDMRAEARHWADYATPLELELYAAAALRQIERTSFAERARKRVFWGLWQAMGQKSRDAFLARVRPP